MPANEFDRERRRRRKRKEERAREAPRSRHRRGGNLLQKWKLVAAAATV